MQPLHHIAWHLPDALDFQDLRLSLADRFAYKHETDRKRVCRWYDTFDWRLYRSNYILTREGQDWILRDLAGKKIDMLRGGRKIYRFSQEFPESSLRDRLAPIISVRALIELGRADIHRERLYILNGDKKTVAQIELKKIVSQDGERQSAIIQLREIRGYSTWMKKVQKYLLDLNIREKATVADVLLFIAEGSGRHPLDYSSKYDVPLDPGMTARDAALRIYRYLLTAIRKNEQGVIDDIDSEFLHDLRVAVRRTRSALTLLKGVLDPAIEQRFKKEFKYIGAITGPVRDLDVYLLSRDSYSQYLPGRLRRGLDIFFDDLAGRRRREQRKMVRAMRGARYRKILDDWENILAPDAEIMAGKNGNIPIGKLAGKIIHKRFRRVLRDGKKIDVDTPDEELHRLRIECKKLRYSLEFFSSLYEPKQMRQFIRQLKMLQDNLGDFNDLSVQQNMLADLLSHVRPGTVKSRELAAALGGLMTGLFLRHRDVRTRFENTFAHFSRKKNLALYHALFGR